MSRKRKAANSIGFGEKAPDSPRESRGTVSRLDWLIALTLAIATIVIFSETWTFDFTNWDDGAYITNNRNLHDAAGLGRIWFSTENEQYYPLTFTTFWLEYQIWGENPTAYHVVNSILHALNMVLVLVLARRLGLSTLLATGVAALFAVHPMQAMTVAWVAERKTLLACLFVLLATLAWMDHCRGGRRMTYVAALVFFMLALLSKTAVLLAPLTWSMLDVGPTSRSLKRRIVSILPLLGLAVFATLVTRHFESGFIDAQVFTMIPTPVHRMLLAGTAAWWYLLSLFVPHGLAPAYPMWNILPTQPGWWLGVLGLGVASGTLIFLRHRLRATTRWGSAWFILLLLPMLGLIAYGNLAVSPVSNHYVYIPCIGLFLALGAMLDRLRARSPGVTRLLCASGCVLLIASVVAVRSQSRVFANSKALWTAALARDANCFAAHLGLGQEALLEKDYPLALEHYSAATRIRPTQYEGHAALGDTLVRMQNWSEARASLDTALSLRPDHVPALLARATVAEHDGDWNTALDFARRALSMDAGDPRTPAHLGILLLRIINKERGTVPTTTAPVDSRITEARAAFARVIELRPSDDSGYRGAVECDRLLRDWASAIATARRGLAVAPNSVPLKNLLAITLARCPDDRLRDGPASVRLAEEIAPAMGGSNHQLLETLACAYGAVGRFNDAASVSHEAARLARVAGNEAAAKANENWAADYAARKPRLD